MFEGRAGALEVESEGGIDIKVSGLSNCVTTEEPLTKMETRQRTG